MVNIVPLDQLLPYSSRRVTVTFAYTDNRGEHANRAKSRQTVGTRSGVAHFDAFSQRVAR